MVTHSNVIPTTANKHQMKYKLLLHIEFQYIQYYMLFYKL